MISLLKAIEELKETEISERIQERISQFSLIKEKGTLEIFKELCFCIMTANCGAEKCIEIHEKIGNQFISLPEENLVKKFKEYGYRFPNKRANYIVNARDYRMELENKLKNNIDEFELREWLVKNVKGLGYKEGSHFLRNIGCKNVAIIDFHIIDILAKHNLIEKPKHLNKNRYIEIEKFLKNIGLKLHLSLAELDLYLWYLETGKVLK
jgi:N-glycosylase/DNA lyase